MKFSCAQRPYPVSLIEDLFWGDQWLATVRKCPDSKWRIIKLKNTIFLSTTKGGLIMRTLKGTKR